jgi:glycerol-1-phosphate dehydrogenase [NAD(P)+]
MTAPLRSTRAGIADVLSNQLSLRDWELAATLGLEEIDRASWDLATESLELVAHIVDRDLSEGPIDPEVVSLLANAAVVSGMAMMVAQSSRPASGAEHKISHAIDWLLGGRGMHGEQVGLGCILSAALHGEDADAWKHRLALLGVPHSPGHLGVTVKELVRVLLAAPSMRPRYTILEHADLDDAGARDLILELWPEAA